jgi:hypothetical protein
MLTWGAAAALVSASAWANDPVPPRALPPEWTAATRDVFFPDARGELVGERPAGGVRDNATSAADSSNRGPGEGEPTGFAWSRLVDEQTLMAEIKRLNNQLAGPLSNPSRFKGGDYQLCRQHVVWLAILMAVVEDYDQRLRLQEVAPVLRHGLARAGRNLQVATDQTYAEARLRKADLDDALRGQRFASEPPEDLAQWSDLGTRALVMQRMEQAQQQQINPALASEREFRRGSDQVRQAAQLLALFTEVVSREAFDDWDDDTYRGLAADLAAASRDLATAAAQQNYDAARAAAARVTHTCTACHEGYRG